VTDETPRFRLSIIGIIVLALFSALFVRLWFLQVAASSEAAQAATSNRVRIVREPAIRGRILDAKGRVLVGNDVADAVTFDRSVPITDEEKQLVIGRLAELLGVDAQQIEKTIDDPRIAPFAPVPVAVDVPMETITYIVEHREEFTDAVDTGPLAFRSYPHGNLGAHVLGYVGQINPDELEALKDQGYRQGDLIGKSGVEQMFESELRGQPRIQRLEVDSRGRVVRVAEDRAPVAGKDVQLTIDLDVQLVAEESLRQGMEGAHGLRCVNASPNGTETAGSCRAGAGSVTVLNATDGSVVAMASAPDFNPAEFGAGIPAETLEAFQQPESGFPLLNRSVQGAYAPGSTWKPISAMGGFASGHLTPQTTFYDEGCLEIGDREFCNAGDRPLGSVDLGRALTVSSDVYFYDLGRDLWQFYNDEVNLGGGSADRGYAIQETAHEFGFGEQTGIGLAGEATGRIPDQEFKEDYNKNNPDLTQREQNSVWLPGDSANLAVGQGDLLVTPLQLANAYAMIANGGTRYTPRLGAAILEPRTGAEETEAEVVRLLAAQRVGQVEIDPLQRAAIMGGLVGVVASGDGTATGAFQGLRDNIAGKTGTAEVVDKQDTSLFAGITPVEPGAGPQYVTVAVVEEGGFGASVAAPIVRRVIEALNGNPNPAPVQARAAESRD
jgi:penicillin-binding protein 2